MRRAAVVAALLTLAAPCACAPAGPPPPPEVLVAAAASLREALSEAAPACEAEAGVRIVFNFGASSDLARQILAAAPADLFFSADEAQMDLVERAGAVEPGTRAAFLSNRLVVVVPAGSSLAVRGAEDLARSEIRLLSLADPDVVPAGRYARAWLERKGAWDRVRDRVLPGVDVRAALAAVESGGAEAGVVYATDAALSRGVKVVHEVPAGEAPRIAYTAALLARRPEAAAARAALDCLRGPGALVVFERHGFIPLVP